MIRYDGQVVLITGAGRGIGLAYARLLAERGATVVLHDVGANEDGTDQNPQVARGAATALQRRGFQVSAASTPIEDRAGCRSLVEEAVKEHGRLDALIHNAGWVAYQSIEELEAPFLDRMVTLGIHATLWLAQAAWSQMKAQRYGRILLTTSDRAIYPQYALEGLAAYSAVKLAVVGITNTLAMEGAAHGILVNAISPVAKTRMWGVEGEPDELRPDAVAPGAAFLVSAACSESGWVLRASNGQFHATKATEAGGVDYPRDLRAVAAATPEAVQTAWSRIANATEEARH